MLWKSAVRQALREAGFGDGLRHEIVIPPGPDGRPGERFWAPSRSLHPPMPPGVDGSRWDVRVVLSRRPSALTVVCLGPLSERGDPEAAAYHTIRAFAERGHTSASAVEAEQVAGEAGVRYQIELGNKALVEWKFAHQGWLFVAGAMCHPKDKFDKLLRLTRNIFQTWEWLDAPAVATARAMPATAPLWSGGDLPGSPRQA
jgi:hypothetical protein